MPNPNWLTAWIKVNSKHVTYPEDYDATGFKERNKPSSSFQQEQTTVSTCTKQQATSPAGRQISIPSSVTDTALPDVLSSSQRSRFRRMNHRQRRQSKSSQRSSPGDTLNKSGRSDTSELLDSSNSWGGVVATASSPSSNKRSASQKRRATAAAEGSPSRHRTVSIDSTRSHHLGERFLTGIFGRTQQHEPSPSPPPPPQQETPSPSRNEHDYPTAAPASQSSASHATGSLPVTTGKYLNEAAFLQQLEQRLQFDCQVAQEGIPRSVTVPPPVQPPPVVEVAPPPPYHYYRTAAVPPSRAASEPPAAAAAAPPPPLPLNLLVESLRSHPFFTGGESNRPCPNCSIQEEQLQSVLDDLEYMRSVAVQNEQKAVLLPNNVSKHVSPDGENGTTQRNASSWPSPSSSRTLAEASKQLNEVSSRHKKQIEQLTKERIRWQQDTHFKLHKFANLCKDLNEESASRNEESLALRKELRAIKDERDEMAEELVRLRAQLQHYEQREDKYQQIEEQLEKYHETRQQHIDEMEQKDKLISELSTKLVASLDQLELERLQSQQRQRRQIIFPVVAT